LFALQILDCRLAVELTAGISLDPVIGVLAPLRGSVVRFFGQRRCPTAVLIVRAFFRLSALVLQRSKVVTDSPA
jgi:hypothetical protein